MATIPLLGEAFIIAVDRHRRWLELAPEFYKEYSENFSLGRKMGRTEALMRQFLEKHRDELRVTDLDTASFIVARGLLSATLHTAVREKPQLLTSDTFAQELADTVIFYLCGDNGRRKLVAFGLAFPVMVFCHPRCFPSAIVCIGFLVTSAYRVVIHGAYLGLGYAFALGTRITANLLRGSANLLVGGHSARDTGTGKNQGKQKREVGTKSQARIHGCSFASG